MYFVTLALCFVAWAGLAYLFLFKKTQSFYFLAVVKALTHQK